MKKLTDLEDDQDEKKEEIEESLKLHAEEYVKMLKSYPHLLNPDFVKGEPVHGVYHYINTADHPPCRSKRRPIIILKKQRRVRLLGNKWSVTE